MKQFAVRILVGMLALGVVSVADVFALDFGKEITVSDGQATPAVWSGYKTGGEDQAVQWNDITAQKWDLEGFFLKQSKLTVVGGYDFQKGYEGIYSGDIFLSTTSTMKYGKDVTGQNPGGQVRGSSSRDNFNTLNNVWGYDYVIHFDTNADNTLGATYKVYKIDDKAQLSSVYYRQNDASGAYRYSSGGQLISSGKAFDYQRELKDVDTGFKGDAELGKASHYALSVDLSFLNPGTSFTAQYTMGCGNDDVIGKGTIDQPVVPEPGTLILLGGGLLGLLVIVRKRVC